MSTNSISASSKNAVNTLVAALKGLNMSPATANAIVTLIQVITSSEPSTQPPIHAPEHVDEAAEAGVHADHATNNVISPPTNISPMVPSGTFTTTPVLATVTSTNSHTVMHATNDVISPPANISPMLPSENSTMTPVPTTVTPTNVMCIPSFVSYRGFTYKIPHTSAQALFYCVTKGRCVGVLSTWEDTSPQVMGVSGSIQSHCHLLK
ncbi:hypothetical protein BDR04DRAFT_1119933 [Suillus decipiens]|nr:hypothetical protein BDR04DRAFT_1119933 [Suillus decipiens]